MLYYPYRKDIAHRYDHPLERFHCCQEALLLQPLGIFLYCYIVWLLLQLLHPQILLVLLLSFLVMRGHLTHLPRVHNHGLLTLVLLSI